VREDGRRIPGEKDRTRISLFRLVDEAANFVTQSLINHAVMQPFGAALFLFLRAVEDFHLATAVPADDVVGFDGIEFEVMRVYGIDDPGPLK
jgi:hypothetical protein